jgi:hypothetical protein
MITEITGNTTIQEIVELINLVESRTDEITSFVLYSDLSGGFYRGSTEVVDFDDLEEYVKGEIKCSDLREIVLEALKTEQGKGVILDAIRESMACAIARNSIHETQGEDL